MADLLEHTNHPELQLPEVGPSPPRFPPSTTERGAPWPRNAKVLVVILAVATLLAALGTWAATRSSDDSTIDDQQAQIDELTAEQQRLTGELVTATSRVTALTVERDTLDNRIATLDGQLATATAGIDELTAERDDLVAERDDLQASISAAEAEVADLETRLDSVIDANATLDQRLAILDIQVGYLVQRAASAEQQRDALIALFPIEFDSSLQGVDLVGTWNLDWDEVYCEGFTSCGTAPAFDQLTITATPEGWLRVTADGVFDAGLFRVDGALYAITQSTTAAPACDGTARLAHVGLTLYAGNVSVLEDGTHQVEDLGATYVVEAPATGTCPAGVAFYGAGLTTAG